MFTNTDGTLTPLGKRFERVLDPENQKQLAEAVVTFFESFQRSAQQFMDAQRRPVCDCPWPHDELAKREWPHVPLSLARAYAEEYVLTGKRP